MTNKERQKSLDKKKWIASEKYGGDLSGAMEYCWACKHRYDIGCTTTQKEREAACLCATAYNRMKREIKNYI